VLRSSISLLSLFIHVALCAVLVACTPISSARNRARDQVAAGDASTELDAETNDAETATSTGAGPDAAKSERAAPTHDPGQSCTEPDARSCEAGNPSRQPLLCSEGVWTAQDACNEGQRCERGECVKIARECIGRTPGERFCDGQLVRSCSGGVSEELERCGELEQCVEQADEVSCRCATGMVEIAGKCQVAMRCEENAGGCDSLTKCTMDRDTRTCGACGDGFSGDGLVGCTPLLIDLGVVDATLVPALSADLRSYRIRLPMFQAQVTLQPKAAEGVKIELNGNELAAGTRWTSEVLSFGEHVLAFTLRASNGLTSRYELVIERAGAEEAFVKAMYPERDDTFGYSVALSGNTLAVGATSEDSSSGGVNGDQTDNAAAESGAVYVFVREGTTWKQEAYLKADDPEEGGYFGGALALDGDTLLVAETRTSPYPNSNERADGRPGAVHVFQRNAGTWSRVATITSPSADVDMFGYSLAIGPDTVVIGAPFDAASGRNAGAVYTLPRDGAWGPLNKLPYSGNAADEALGWSLALQQDSLLVGAPAKTLVAEHEGKVVYYARSAGTWQEQQVIAAPMPETGACFGWSVALQGDRAAIGSPFASLFTRTPRGQAFVYQRVDGTWQMTKPLHATVPRDSDYFGASVGFAGNTLLVAASGDGSGGSGVNADPNQGRLEQSGAFYLFGLQGEDWVRNAFIKPRHVAANLSLGQATAVSGDTIVIGAINESTAASGINGEPSGTIAGSGAVYVFR
jgi:trimeric autotransporter adhesin